MAKQNFTTGQVLTAAQMLSLQQTAMLGGSAAVKTTNYVLVSGDAGTQIALNATSTTTVTVNTGIFSTGDIITIVNQNTGAAVITAGTATVRKATNASLTLSQYQGGVLDFISASEAIFFPFDVGSAAGSSSNLNYQDFTSSGTFNVPAGVTNVLVFAVGGGGGGGGAQSNVASGRQYSAGGGGGGDVIYRPINVTGGSAISVTIGTGGTGGASTGQTGGNGNNTTFGSLLTAAGGGGGGGAGTGANNGNIVTSPNNSTGGGGGAGVDADATNVCGVGGGGGGATSSGEQPFLQSVTTSANLIYSSPYGGGYKGGARSIRGRTLSSAGNFSFRGGNGGQGFNNYGGGGGGAGDSSAGFGGYNAGDGGVGNNAGNPATANFGGGGGGSASASNSVANAGGNGGSGFLRVIWVA